MVKAFGYSSQFIEPTKFIKHGEVQLVPSENLHPY